MKWWDDTKDDPVLITIIIAGAVALYLLVFCFVPAINTLFNVSIPPGYLWCPKAFHDSRCAE